MNILKYVIDDAGLPIIFSVDHQHTDILTTIVAAGYVIINYDYEKEFFLLNVMERILVWVFQVE
jgi:hypothetical protein